MPMQRSSGRQQNRAVLEAEVCVHAVWTLNFAEQLIDVRTASTALAPCRGIMQPPTPSAGAKQYRVLSDIVYIE